jgi:hypothetical protein
LEGKTSKTSNKIIGFVMNWQVRRGGQGAKCIGSNNKNGNKRRSKRKENKKFTSVMHTTHT